MQINIPQNLDFLDSEIDKLMKSAEEHAANALSKLNLAGFGAPSETEGQMSNIKGNSQETHTLDDGASSKKAKEGDKRILDMDEDEVGSADSGEFDKQKDS